MNKIGRFIGLLALVIGSQVMGWSAAMPIEDDLRGWEKLGVKKVNYGIDRDVIYVTAKDGMFTKLKLKVRKAAINLHKFEIHYGNGEVQRVDVRKNIRKGGTTRVIDINGGRRVVKKVVFWYDTKNKSRRRASLELWGKH